MRPYATLPLLLFALLTSQTGASTLRVCTLDKPFAPFTMPDDSGETQELLRRAAAETGFTIDNLHAPRPRCFEYLKSGEVQGLISAFAPERISLGVFPMNGKDADATRSLAVTRFLLYRPAGSTLQWDGKHFSGRRHPTVAAQPGFQAAQLLRASGATVDDGAHTVDQNLGKLALGRVDAVVALENEAAPIVKQNYAGSIEAQAAPFALLPLYLQVNHAYYDTHRKEIDALWNAIQKVRESVPYQAYLNNRR